MKIDPGSVNYFFSGIFLAFSGIWEPEKCEPFFPGLFLAFSGIWEPEKCELFFGEAYFWLFPESGNPRSVNYFVSGLFSIFFRNAGTREV